MTHRRILGVAAALCLGVLHARTAAAVPDAMRVQGTLLTTSGSPATGPVDLTITLWDTNTGGTNLWSKTLLQQELQGGVFDVELTAVPASLFATFPALWLETKVGTEAPLPRQRLDTAPYAFRAASADEASGLACSGCVGAADLGAGAIGAVHLADGAITPAKVSFNYAGSASKGGAATDVTCTGCVAPAELSQAYAGAATPGGAAADVACTGCVSAAEVAFPWAAGTSAGGPAAGLECAGCVGVSDLEIGALDARYLARSGGTITGDLIVTGTVTAAAFAGDGSQLTGIGGGGASGNCEPGNVVTGIAPDGTIICSKLCAVSPFTGSVGDGSTSSGVDLRFQYAPLGTGQGYIKANWTPQSGIVGYQLAIGTTLGGTDVKDFASVGTSAFATVTGLTLQGAWTGTTYYVSVRGVCEGGLPTAFKTSNGLQIAEGATWTGDQSGLRAPDSGGGYTASWPQSGILSVYGSHWFETVAIGASSTVYVQGWGRAQGVGESIAASAAAVTSPADGWLALYANTITVDGMITASGRGYGGGAGGGGGFGSPGQRGRGGSGGLGGTGGPGEGGSGGGGGGSPGGAGGSGGNGAGGAGNIYGGGSGSTSCSGQPGRAGGDGPASDIGGHGANAGGSAGAGGAGEYGPGGGNGVTGCDSRSGGGGGGYGGGGSGGTQWAGPGTDCGGGGAGGSGGVGGGDTPVGGAGAGPFGGGGGSSTGAAGGGGGYRTGGGNGDSTTDRTLFLGSGGGGGGAGWQEAGGGGGGAGGGWVRLYAADTLTIGSAGKVLSNGAGGGGGARDDGGNANGATGGGGAGGGVVLEGRTVVMAGSVAQRLSARGGAGSTGNGGTIKLFYETWSGAKPAGANAGRVYDAGAGSFQ